MYQNRHPNVQNDKMYTNIRIWWHTINRNVCCVEIWCYRISAEMKRLAVALCWYNLRSEFSGHGNYANWIVMQPNGVNGKVARQKVSAATTMECIKTNDNIAYCDKLRLRIMRFTLLSLSRCIPLCLHTYMRQQLLLVSLLSVCK